MKYDDEIIEILADANSENLRVSRYTRDLKKNAKRGYVSLTRPRVEESNKVIFIMSSLLIILPLPPHCDIFKSTN